MMLAMSGRECEQFITLIILGTGIPGVSLIISCLIIARAIKGRNK